jgi:hypothetical protein
MNKLNIDLDMLEPVVSTPKKKKLDIIEDLETLPEVADW